MKIPYFSKSTVNTAVFISVLGILLVRFYHISTNDFIFYDEGMYLNYNRPLLHLVSQNPPKNLSEFFIILQLMYKAALATPKALWFFLMNLRVFVFGQEGYFFSRWLSALSGLVTVGLTYVWARKYFQSKAMGVVSALILGLLPSHVFYARQGMQESISCLFFLSGMYFFVFSKKGMSIRIVLSALFMFAVFLTNYRMIVAPVYIGLFLVYMFINDKKHFDYQKLFYFLGVYGACFIVLGLLENGINLKANAAWMLNQAGEARQYRQWYNFLSFPYYLFKLENILFGALFFTGFYCLAIRKIKGMFPFLVVLCHMILFSFAAEKGARYLCVVLPFACMAVAQVIRDIYTKNPRLGLGVAGVMMIGFCFTSWKIMASTSGYEKAIITVKAHDPQAKMIATQPMVEQLFLKDPQDIVALPKDMAGVAHYVSQGYRYLIIDPQLFVSWEEDEKRFTLKELSFINQLREHLPLRAMIAHFNDTLLERFVLDHNQDLLISLMFLSQSQGKGSIFIYDLGVLK